MHEKFRITYVRTVYKEIELAAETCHDAEGLFEAMAATLPEALDRGTALTSPRYRVIDVVPLDDADGMQADDGRQAAMAEPAARVLALRIALEPAA